MAGPMHALFARAASKADELVCSRTESALETAFAPPSAPGPDESTERLMHRLSWLRLHPSAKVVSALAPQALDQRVADLPATLGTALGSKGVDPGASIVRVIHDVKVQPSRKERTDDAVYESDAIIRERLPRGLAFVEIRAVETAELAAVREGLARGEAAPAVEAVPVLGMRAGRKIDDVDGIRSLFCDKPHLPRNREAALAATDQVQSEEKATAALAASIARGDLKPSSDVGPAGITLSVRVAVRGLTKFTGGIGDDDDKLPGSALDGSASAGSAPSAAGASAAAESEPAWKRFFTADLGSATHVAVMGKANGESGHLGCYFDPILDEYVAVAGSKNVHVAFRPSCRLGTAASPAAAAEAAPDAETATSNPDLSDVAYRTGGRFGFALAIGIVVDRILSTNHATPSPAADGGSLAGAAGAPDPLAAWTAPPPPRTVAEELLHLLCRGRATLCFEHLSPAHLHVERCELTEATLVAIGWQSNLLEPPASLRRGLNPLMGRALAEAAGLGAVSEKLVPMAGLEAQMAETRGLYGVEGHVLYFVDAAGHVIGLLKKKAVWYIVVRALREKVKGMLSAMERARKALAAEPPAEADGEGSAEAAAGRGARRSRKGRKAAGAGAGAGSGAAAAKAVAALGALVERSAKATGKTLRALSRSSVRCLGLEPGLTERAGASRLPSTSAFHPDVVMAGASGWGAPFSTDGSQEALLAALDESIRRQFHLRCAQRMVDVQQWLRISDATRLRWTALAHGVVEHAWREGRAGRATATQASEAFPVIWDAFLTSSGEDDHVAVELDEEAGAALAAATSGAGSA